jgi:maltooligosyltrehalose trehalohydrolase
MNPATAAAPASATAPTPPPAPTHAQPTDLPAGPPSTLGADLSPGGVRFRIWAPALARVEIVLEDPALDVPMQPDGDGHWVALVPEATVGTRYRFRVDGHERLLPDPWSRYQPDGPHGPSQVVDPRAFEWSDADWKGVTLRGQVIYEMHIGTFTPAGTWAGATEKLRQLRDLGVTVLQVMPIGEFPGTFGWGYDGVQWFAPYHHYGPPDDLRRFIDEAHRLDLAVILDVVYNHFGPDGNYLAEFSPHFFSEQETEWGRAINYDGPHAHGSRTLVIENAAYWIRDFHFDGLRLDATQSIRDESDDHLIAALARAARAAAGDRQIVIVAESEPQDSTLVRPPQDGGHGLDAVYNEDFHHSALVAATGRREGYYSEYRGTGQELLSAFKRGFLFQGQLYHWQKKRRGKAPRGLPLWACAAFLENHDQVANSGTGARLWRETTRGRHRALTTLLLLGPWTPLLFQGSEWNASSPFLYFANHEGDLRSLVRKGRAQFLAQFPSIASLDALAALPDPGDRAVFESSRLHWEERTDPAHASILALHRDLMKVRRQDPAVVAQGGDGVTVDGAVLSPECFVVRFFAPDPQDDRLLLVNLGPQLTLVPAPEPLLAAPEKGRWQVLFSSDDRAYGGPGLTNPESETSGWEISAHAAVLLRPTFTASHDQH